VEETGRHRLAGRLPATQYVGSYCLLAPPAWLVTVPAQSRSGRAAILTVASPESFTLSPEEEQILVRLSRQALLVLDHALLTQQVEGLEVTDALTGVATHRRLLDVLEYEIERHRYTGSTLTLMVVDVEGLAGINRSYGNQYGDHLLTKLAGLIGDVVRPVDVVARCGLDEFAVVLPETREEEGRELADELRERVRSVTFAGDAVQISIGTTHARPSEALTAETLLRRAEQALQDAKRQERDWNALWTPGAKKGMR
jgi:diguanylate cyclase (GGDEF)-like protein